MVARELMTQIPWKVSYRFGKPLMVLLQATPMRQLCNVARIWQHELLFPKSHWKLLKGAIAWAYPVNKLKWKIDIRNLINASQQDMCLYFYLFRDYLHKKGTYSVWMKNDVCIARRILFWNIGAIEGGIPGGWIWCCLYICMDEIMACQAILRIGRHDRYLKCR